MSNTISTRSSNYSRFSSRLGKSIRSYSCIRKSRDDLMNLTSEDMAKQKTFAEDLTEGKFSFPIIHSLSKGDKGGDDTILSKLIISILCQINNWVK